MRGVPVRGFVGPRAGAALAATTAVAAVLAAGVVAVAVPAAPASGAVRPMPLRWAQCPAGQVPEELPPLECSSMVVPVDHANPRAGTIVLALYRTQLPAGTARPAKILFVNSGGPGGEASLLTSLAGATYPAAVRRAYDVIGVDPRGVGRSVPVSCTELDPEADLEGEPADEVVGEDDEAAAPQLVGGTPNLLLRTQQQRRQAAQAARALVEGCLRRSGPLLPYLTTDRTARDFDLVRARLGQPTAAFVGYSYGTLLFSRYATLFPNRVERLVLDSAVDPGTWGLQFFQERALPFERRLGDFAAWAAGHDEQLRLGGSAQQVLATYDRIIADLDVEPLVLEEDLAIGAGDVQNLVTLAMYGSAAWPEAGLALSDLTTLLDGGTPAAPGARASRSVRLAAAVAAARSTSALPQPGPDNQASALYSVLCNEGDFPQGTRPVLTRADRLLEQAPRIGPVQVNGALPCTLWPAAATSEPGPTQGIRNVPGVTPLVVQAQRDPVTTYRMGVALTRLTGSRLLTVTGGDHTHFGIAGERCTDEAVGRYLTSGALPRPGTVCAGAPAPLPLPPDDAAPTAESSRGTRPAAPQQLRGTALEQARDAVRRAAG